MLNGRLYVYLTIVTMKDKIVADVKRLGVLQTVVQCFGV